MAERIQQTFKPFSWELKTVHLRSKQMKTNSCVSAKALAESGFAAFTVDVQNSDGTLQSKETQEVIGQESSPNDNTQNSILNH